MNRQHKAKISQNQQWTVIQRGQSLSELQLMTIMDCLQRQRIKDFSLLAKIAYQVSRALQFTLGRGSWQVIFFRGPEFAKKFASSGKYYIILQRADHLLAFIWLNKIKGVQY